MHLLHSKLSDSVFGRVENPNYFAVSFSKIQATVCTCLKLSTINVLTAARDQIFYPINNTNVGGGNATDITFNSHSETNFTFPFTISYQKSLDPNDKILVDIATKCGFIGGSKSPITVDYKISVSLSAMHHRGCADRLIYAFSLGSRSSS
jgi:hypothetical protein